MKNHFDPAWHANQSHKETQKPDTTGFGLQGAYANGSRPPALIEVDPLR